MNELIPARTLMSVIGAVGSLVHMYVDGKYSVHHFAPVKPAVNQVDLDAEYGAGSGPFRSDKAGAAESG